MKGADQGLSYALAGGPPDDWYRLRIRDLDSGELVEEVVEINTEEGWAIVHERPLRHDLETGKLAVQRIEGRFAIERQPAEQDHT